MIPVLASVFIVTTLVPSRLRCESLPDPIGVDVAKPRLSWIVTSNELGQRQTAYRILVGSAPGKWDLWDSGKVPSSETIGIRYAGRPLISSQRVFWCVQVWDRTGHASGASDIATWTMHLLKPRDWRGKWIGAFEQPSKRRGIGYHALEAKSLDETKWVQVDLGRQVSIERIVLHPVRNHLGYAYFGFPPQFRVEAASDADFRAPVLLHAQTRDVEASGPFSISTRGHTARYVRVIATRLYRRKDGVGCFALAELEVDSVGKNVALGKPVAALDSVERDDWTRQALTDGRGVGETLPITILLRKDVGLTKPVKRAICYVSGLGQYEMHINGRKVGQDWITPGWTQYQKSTLVDAYDVTSMLRHGKNALAIHVGNGMYDMSSDWRGSQQQNSLGTHKAYCQIMAEHPDGTSTTFVSDQTWRWHESAETYSGVFGGEDWDARIAQKGWDEPGFDDRSWKHALEVNPPSPSLHGITHGAPPIRVIEMRTPVASTEPKSKVVVLDLGQNAPYIPQFTVHGERGASITFWPAEMLNADGTVDQRTMRAGKRVTYTLAGIGDETWHPIFWYCGSRYWQVDAKNAKGESIDPKVLLKAFTGLLVHSSATQVGNFQCSNKLFNDTYRIIHWAMRSNLASVISDCPHREKSGWLEEDTLNGPGLMYNFDLSAMFRKVVEDMRDAQQPSGMVPTMAPEYFIYDKGFRDSVEWGGSYLFLPQFMRDWYADAGVIRDHYSGMKRYVDYLNTQAKDHILSNGLGDWNGYGNDARTPVAITDTAYFYACTSTLAQFAADIGSPADTEKYGRLAEAIASSFQRHFLDRASGKVGTGSQSAQATALDLGLIDAPDQPAVFRQLLKDVEEHEYAVSCGEVGHPSMLRMLSAYGRSDLVARIHSQTDKPGYGYQIKKGMTTLTEAWDASPISLNHFMLGHIMEWFFADLAGINPDPAGPGYKSAIIRPRPVPEVTWAKATYDSIRGPYSVSWKLDGNRFTMDVEIPANCSAKVYVPAQRSSIVWTANGRSSNSKRISSDEQYTVYELTGGLHHVTGASAAKAGG